MLFDGQVLSMMVYSDMSGPGPVQDQGVDMTFIEMIDAQCDRLGLSRKEMAEKCGISPELIQYMEDPQGVQERLVVRCAAALGIKLTVFTGDEVPEPTLQEKRVALLAAARFPKIRMFLMDPACCVNPEKSVVLFGEDGMSPAERHLILELLTNALYRFCETNCSGFRFDEYLFRVHSDLFANYSREVGGMQISDEEKLALMDTARFTVFACDTMKNIAGKIVKPFAEEFEEKLANGVDDFDEDLTLPFRWDFNDEQMKLLILDAANTVTREISIASSGGK